MIIESWRWPVAAGQAVSVKDRSRSSQFGDGTTQNVLEGVNPFTLDFPISWTGEIATGKEIVAFLKSHVAYPFKMVPPAGELGLFTVKTGTIKYTVISRHYMTVTFEVQSSVGVYGGTRG